MSILDNKQLELQKNDDPLVDYLVKKFDDDGRFELQSDGTMYCGDSNATLDPHEMAKEIRELLGLIGSAG